MELEFGESRRHIIGVNQNQGLGPGQSKLYIKALYKGQEQLQSFPIK